MTNHCDVVINGAGITGLTLALLLARQAGNNKLRILLLARQPLVSNEMVHAAPQSVEDFDLRVFALTEASKLLLADAGAWPHAGSQRVYPYQQMRVWDAGGDGAIHFDAAELGVASLGAIVESSVLRDWLVAQVLLERAIEIKVGDELVTLEMRHDCLRVTLVSGDVYQAALLVGADGAGSRVRQLAGIDTVGWSYRQQALVATVETESDHQATAWQRFLPRGSLAFLPMQRPWCSIVWSVPERRADELYELDDAVFLQTLDNDFEGCLGGLKAVGKRAKFPLQAAHAQSYIGSRVVLVADAAHTVHPLAGQGLNLGLLDVAALAVQLQSAQSAGRDMGGRRVLRAYERARKGDNWLMQGSLDCLKRLFGNEQVFLARLRNAGLDILDQAPLVKNALARKAMGL